MTFAMDKPQALWIVEAGRAEIRPAAAGTGEVSVETICSGISRGTERLVLSGKVPRSEWQRMRAPHQEGEFGFPVKYGYSAVGRVVSGGELAGKTIFCLHPHQTRFKVPADAAVPLPAGVPPERAVLGANMETALNIVWDAGVAPGDRVTVIGAGVVGALTAWLCARIPGTETTLVDIDPAKSALVRSLGCAFASPSDMPGDCDVAINASASDTGLQNAMDVAGIEGRIVEASWFGAAPAALRLGGAFHSRRLSIVSSQVGSVPPGRRARWTHRRRLAKALQLLADPRLDALISGESRFSDLPADYPDILAAPDTLCHRIRYD